mmetsp:Transcript_89705/g.252931  ORF Transcript_89705/g.252931 Transcript_89705/m.252931 type:complete len:479 (-) Transcript_89705:70-1506(-)
MCSPRTSIAACIAGFLAKVVPVRGHIHVGLAGAGGTLSRSLLARNAPYPQAHIAIDVDQFATLADLNNSQRAVRSSPSADSAPLKLLRREADSDSNHVTDEQSPYASPWSQNPNVSGGGAGQGGGLPGDPSAAHARRAVDASSERYQCNAPMSIGFVNPACKEGFKLASGQWCTPQCEHGRTPFINISGIAPTSTCVGEDGINYFGGRLCCSFGRLYPDTFRCVVDLFGRIDRMDGREDGLISREQFKGFFNTEVVNASQMKEIEDVEQAAKVGAQEDNKMMKKVIKKVNNPLVYGFIIIVTGALITVAVVMVVLVVTYSPEEAKKPTQHAPAPPKAVEPIAADGGGAAAAAPPPPKEPPKENELYIPVTLVVRSKQDYQGAFNLEPGTVVNGQPLWKKVDANYWIFSGTSGQWFIGDQDERDVDFNCDTGKMVSESSHQGVMPHKMGPTWKEFNAASQAWQPAPDSLIVDPDDGPGK